MKWNIQQADKEQIKQYMKKLDINEIMATILVNRNISLETAEALLSNPQSALLNPGSLINAKAAAKEIIEAIQNNAEIWVYADYDVDGITSGYIITDFLRKTTNNNIFVYYPDRIDGYGLNLDFCQTLVTRKAEENIDNMLVITVDNGVTCIEEVDFLKQNGINIVITDHHKPKEVLPNCTVVNPHIDKDPLYHHLAGCGVAFKLIQVIQEAVNMNEDFAAKYYFAVALGTVSDVMPMNPENIALVKLGIEQLNSKDCPKAFKLFKNYIDKKILNPNDIAWEIAPRLNACGRMGNIDKAATLFFTDDDDQKSEVMDIIIEIEELNEERKALTKKAEKEIEKIDYTNDYACFFDASKYNAGICGIIAGKLAERYNKPAFAYSGFDIFTGSARSIEGLNLQSFLQKEMENGNLMGFGGHEQAAGFSLDADKIEDFKESLNNQLKDFFEYAKECETELSLEPELDIDTEIDLECINRTVYEGVNLFPYDKTAFPQPTFYIPDLNVVSVKASKNNGNNINITLRDKRGNQISIWAWKMGELYDALGKPKVISIAGTIDADFMKKNQYTLKVLDIKIELEKAS